MSVVEKKGECELGQIPLEYHKINFFFFFLSILDYSINEDGYLVNSFVEG